MTYSFKYNFKPRFSDIDMYDIAHHSKYFCWYEEARYYFLDNILNISKDDIIQLYAPITSLKADYKKAVVFNNEYVILVKAIIDELKAVAKFEYQIMDKYEETLFATGYTEHVFIKSTGELLLEIPEFLYKKIKKVGK